MKNIYILIVLLFSSAIYSQTTGITYQAVILNPAGQNIPGYNNNRLPLSNKLVCLRFKILAGTTLEYQETMPTTTDEFGMVNVIIGTGTPAGGTASTFSDIVWNGSPKSLVVEVDVNALCTNFIEISNQPFTAVPYALYSASSGTTGATGPQGPAGPTGATGAQGPQGVAGATGPQGPIGLTGPAGPQGVAGANGASGLQGANGLSAYQVAVANGFNGTEIQWLTSLVGSQGLQGVAGIAGQDGKNALINTTLEPSGTNCPNGGTKIEVGLDNNSNGVLDNSEINASQTKYVCNGAQGIAGPQGPAGTSSTSIGSNAAFSDAITTYNGDISICGNYTSLAVSNNGKYIIMGCPSDNSNGISNAGKVIVLKYENGTFENVGQEFIGTSLNSRFGKHVGVSGDGQTIFFVGNTTNDCYIYKLLNNSWILHSTINDIGIGTIKMNITGDLIISRDNVPYNSTQTLTFYNLVGTNWVSNQFSVNGILGNSANMEISNDGSIIALSNSGQNLGVYPNPFAVANGRTGVFYYDGSTFIQRGNFIEGPNTKGWGYRICLSDDGTKIGITTSGGNTPPPYYVRTYQFNTTTSTWEQYNNELVFNSYNNNTSSGIEGQIAFLDFDSSNNYLLVAHKIEFPAIDTFKSYFLLMKNINNNWNQFGTSIEFKPIVPTNYTNLPDNFEFKSNIFYHVIDNKLRIKDFN
jgi:hypothetical protein